MSAGDAAEGTGGFTLIEILVVISILAVLAAVLFPTVTDVIGRADPVQAKAVLNNLQTGTERFQVDVRRTPGRIEHLSNPIRRGELTVNEIPYPDTTKWSGRYIDTSLPGDLRVDSVTGIEVGFDGQICNDIFPVNSATSTNWSDSDVRGDVAGCADFGTIVASPDYAAVVADSMEWTDWQEIDQEIDGGDGPNDGRVRWGDIDDQSAGNVRRMILLVAPLLPSER